jgi:hypothetical protein
MAVKHWCLNCGSEVKTPRYVYLDEVICKACWERRVPYLRRATYRNIKRNIRHVEKAEIMDPRYRCTYWPTFAENLCRTWAYILKDLDIDPPRLAGFNGFMKEMGFDRQPL